MAARKKGLVFRVTGLAASQPDDELNIRLKATIDDNLSDEEKSNLHVSTVIVPSCYDDEQERVALVEFHDKVPTFLSELAADPLGDWQVEMGDTDINFDGHFLGFTQLYAPKPDAPVSADIIAITGLDGWRGKGNLRRMWLRDFLSKDLPCCRTMTYGYNSKLSSHGVDTIMDYGRELIEEIKKVRNTEELRQRPLFFIAHSFGGIILAHYLVKAVQADKNDHPTITALYRATYGMLLFAIPHKGLLVDDIQKILAGQDNHPRNALLRQIRDKSNLLAFQLADFKNLIRDRKVVSFYETEQIRQLEFDSGSKRWKRNGDFVTAVDTDSALLQLPDHMEEKIPLQANYSQIVKFDSKTSTGYRSALGRLRQFEQDAPLIVSARFVQGLQKPDVSPTTTLPKHSKIDDSPALLDTTQRLQANTALLDFFIHQLNTFSEDRSMHRIDIYAEPGRENDAIARALIKWLEESGDEAKGTILLRRTLARSYRKLGSEKEALEIFCKTLAASVTALGEHDQLVLQLKKDIVRSFSKLGQEKRALEILRDTLDASVLALGDRDRFVLRLTKDLARSQSKLGLEKEALQILKEAVPTSILALGKRDRVVLLLQKNLALTYSALGQEKEAYKILVDALQDSGNEFGAQDRGTLKLMNAIAKSLSKLGDEKEALKRRDEVVEISCRKFGEHPVTLKFQSGVARSYSKLGQEDRALQILLDTQKASRRILGEEHPDTLNLTGAVALSYSTLGQETEALSLREETVKVSRRKLGNDHPDTLRFRGNLARSYSKLGQEREALNLRQAILEDSRRVLGEEHPETLRSMGDVAWSHSALGQEKEALSLREQMTKVSRRKLGDDHPETLRFRGNLARSYSKLGQEGKALQLLQAVLEGSRRVTGEEHPETLRSMGDVAWSYSKLGQEKEALSLREQMVKASRRKLGDDHPKTLRLEVIWLGATAN